VDYKWARSRAAAPARSILLREISFLHFVRGAARAANTRAVPLFLCRSRSSQLAAHKCKLSRMQIARLYRTAFAQYLPQGTPQKPPPLSALCSVLPGVTSRNDLHASTNDPLASARRLSARENSRGSDRPPIFTEAIPPSTLH
jgi:hypothetical protein